MSWRSLSRSDPGMAARGRRLFEREGAVAIGFLATVSERGFPRLAPVCPIFCDEELYLSVGSHTQKARDLLANGRYTLHAFLGRNDEEFQVSGVAVLVTDEKERMRVHSAIRFPVFNVDDPVFRLEVESGVWSEWDGPSERPSRRRHWRNPSVSGP